MDERRSIKRESNTILLVEDDPASRKLVRAVLQYEGYRIIEAEDIREAERYLRDAVPSLVLLDIRLKNRNGLELARSMRSNVHYQRVPIVALTAQALKQDEERILAAGVDVYLPKPVDTRRLREVVGEMNRRGRVHVG